MVAAVGLVADRTVLDHGRVFEGVWTPLFRVTLVAKVLHRFGLDHLGSHAAVRGMAIGAFYLALLDGMVGLFFDLISHVLVAGETKLRLIRLEIVDR